MTLADCLSKFGKTFSANERAALFEARKAHLATGIDVPSAEMAAAAAMQVEAQTEHKAVLDAIAKAVEVRDLPVFETKQAAMLEAQKILRAIKTRFKAEPHPTKADKWTIQQVVRSEAQQSAAQKTARRQRAARKPDESRDTITTFIAKMGGLRLSEAPDLTGETKPMRAPNAPMLFLIRKKGGLGLDAMGEYLHEAGYFTERPDEQEIRDAIGMELDGQNQYSVWGTEAQPSALEEKSLEQERAAAQFAEQAGIDDLEQVSTLEDISTHRDFIPAIESEMTGPRLALAELNLKLAQLDPEAPGRLAEQYDAIPDEEYARVLQEAIDANLEDVAGRDRGVGEAVEPFALAGETEQERAAREASARDRADRAKREADERDARDRADAELGDFGLTGSERAADVAAAAGQTSLLQENVDVQPADKSFAKFKKLTQAVQHVVSKGDPFYVTLGRRIAQSVEGATFTVVESGVDVPGGVPIALRGARGVQMTNKSKGLNGVWVKGNSFGAEQGINDQTVMHEALHQATARKIELGNMRASAGSELQKSVSELYALANHVITAYKQTSNPSPELSAVAAAAFNDPRELVSHGLTTPVVQEFLKATPGLHKKSAWSEFVDSIRKILGLAVEHTSALADLIEITDRIIASEIPADVNELESQLVSQGLAQQLPRTNAPPTTPVQQTFLPAQTPAQKTAFVAFSHRELKKKVRPPQGEYRGLIARFGMGVADYIVTPRTIAVFNEPFVPVYTTVIKRMQFVNQAIANLERIMAPYLSANEADAAVINKVFEHDRLTGSYGLAGKNMTVHFTSKDAVLSKPGDRVTVTDAQKTAYWAAREGYDKGLMLLRDQTAIDFGFKAGMTSQQILAAMPGGTTPAHKTRWLRAAEEVKTIEDARLKGWVPFMRYGDVGITARAANGEVVGYTHVEAGILGALKTRPADQIPDVKKRMAEFKAELIAQGKTGFTFDKPFHVPKSNIAPQVNIADVDMLAEIGNVDPVIYDQARAGLVKGQAVSGHRKHLLHSKNIAGYSTDFQRSSANYIVSLAGHLGKRHFADQLRDAVAAIPLNDPTLRQYAKDYVKYVDTPGEEFAFLRTVNFVKFMTSPMTLGVNLMQTQFVAVPWASQFAPVAVVQAAFLRAQGETVTMLTLRNGLNVLDPNKAPADVRAAVKEVYDKGDMIATMTLEAIGQAQDRGKLLKHLTPAARRVVEAVGVGYTATEQANRFSTFIALYRLARDRPQLQAQFARVMQRNALARDTSSNWTPTAFAEFGVDDTQMRQGKVNRQRMARKAGTVVFQFKSGYLFQMIERIVTMLSLHGSEGKAASILILMIIGTVAGMFGLPFADDMRRLWEAAYKFFKHTDFNTEMEVRKLLIEITGKTLNDMEIDPQKFAEGMVRGVSSGFPIPWNVDFSKRFSIGKVVPSTLEELAGVSADTFVTSPLDAVRQLNFGNYLLALAEINPKLTGDPMTALSWSQIGVRTGKDKQVIPPFGQPNAMTVGELLVKAVGGTPGRLSEVRAREQAEKRIQHSTDEMKSIFYARMSKAEYAAREAEKAGDTADAKLWRAEVDKIWAEVKAWNDSHKQSERIKLSKDTRDENLKREYQGAERQKGKRRVARGETRSIQDLYGTEVRP